VVGETDRAARRASSRIALLVRSGHASGLTVVALLGAAAPAHADRCTHTKRAGTVRFKVRAGRNSLAR
jgi:hypothetical protein